MNSAIIKVSKSIKIPKNSTVIPFSYGSFPAGEEFVRLLNADKFTALDKVLITSSPTSSSDIMQLAMLTNCVKNSISYKSMELLMPYFPYARQDRVMVKGESLSVKVMANLINTQKYDKVHILDPHSDVTTALIDNVHVIDKTPFIKSVWDSINGDKCIVSPDAGALKKVVELGMALNISNENIIYGSKYRNLKDGSLSGFDFSGNVKGKVCVIVDDIVDGGGTFIGLADKLKKGGCTKVHLICSHGILSKGIQYLTENGIDRVHITDSIQPKIIDEYPIVHNIESFSNIFDVYDR